MTSLVWSSGRFWLLSVLSLRRILAFVRCELQSPPCFLAYCGAPWLMALRSSHCRITAGLASMDRRLLVSSVESQLCECLFVVLPRQLVGSGVYSPASPICPTSSVLKRCSFGISASVFASSLRDGVTLPARVCLSSRSERSLFLHLPGVWLEPSRWDHPVGSSLSQISIGTKTLRTFPSGWRQAFAMGLPVSGRVALFCALDRNEGFFRSSILRCFTMGSP